MTAVHTTATAEAPVSGDSGVGPFLTDDELAVGKIRIVLSGAVSGQGGCGNTGDSRSNCGGGGDGADLILAVGGRSSDGEVEVGAGGEVGGGNMTKSNANDRAPYDGCDNSHCLFLSWANFGLMAAAAIPAFIVAPTTMMVAA